MSSPIAVRLRARRVRRTQRRSARDLRRRMAELDRLDRVGGLGTMPTAHTKRVRTRRPLGPVLPALVVTLLTVGVGMLFSPAPELEGIRRAVGIGAERLGEAPEIVPGQGTYAFMQTQPFGNAPVGYDPCREIEVRINPDGAPAGYQELVRTSMERVAAATGLRFVRGPDSARDRIDPGFSTERRPVLVAWSTADQVPELEGRVAGIGGSMMVERAGVRRYVTGEVILDRDVFDRYDTDDRAVAQAIVDHEFGHLVGLDHVTDRRELMHVENIGRTRFGPGDLEGLARLGNIDC